MDWIYNTGDNMTFDDLHPDTLYNFYLAAVNAVGAGQAVKFKVKTPRRPNQKEQSGMY
jgi:hypothetical protein